MDPGLNAVVNFLFSGRWCLAGDFEHEELHKSRPRIASIKFA